MGNSQKTTKKPNEGARQFQNESYKIDSFIHQQFINESSIIKDKLSKQEKQETQILNIGKMRKKKFLDQINNNLDEKMIQKDQQNEIYFIQSQDFKKNKLLKLKEKDLEFNREKQQQQTPYELQDKQYIRMKSLDGRKIKITSDILEDEQKDQRYISKVVQYSEVVSQVVEQENDKLAVERIQEIQFEHKQVASLICDEIMNVPFTKEQLKISQKLQKEYLKRVQEDNKNNKQSVYLVILLLKSYLENQGGTVIIEQKSTLRSSLTVKIFSTGFMLDRVKFTQEIDQEKTEWKFQDLKDNQKSLKAFQAWYKQKLFQQTGIKKEDVIIHKLTHCCILVQSSIQLGAMKGCRLRGDMVFHPYFKHFSLCVNDFDCKGDIKFNNEKRDIQKRGNWPYYQPIKCCRFGLKVSGKYDGGQDTWLKMNNVIGEWAVGFHGVRSAKLSLKKILKGLNQQQQERKKGQMLKTATINKCQQYRAINKQGNIKVGKGIYCTPHIKYSLGYAHPTLIPSIQKSYRLIFQCRMNPNKLKVCQNYEQEWVVNNSKDVRPYGIILMKEQIAAVYKQTIAQFGQQFKWNKYKNYIQQRTKKLQEQSLLINNQN